MKIPGVLKKCLAGMKVAVEVEMEERQTRGAPPKKHRIHPDEGDNEALSTSWDTDDECVLSDSPLPHRFAQLKFDFFQIVVEDS